MLPQLCEKVSKLLRTNTKFLLTCSPRLSCIIVWILHSLGGRDSVVIRYGVSSLILGGKKRISLPKTPNTAELGHIQLPPLSTLSWG